MAVKKAQNRPSTAKTVRTARSQKKHASIYKSKAVATRKPKKSTAAPKKKTNGALPLQSVARSSVHSKYAARASTSSAVSKRTAAPKKKVKMVHLPQTVASSRVHSKYATSARTSSVPQGPAALQARYQQYLDEAMEKFGILKNGNYKLPASTVALKSPNVQPRSMWFVNLCILSCTDEEMEELEEFMEKPEVLHETQVVVNYDRLEKELEAKATKIIEKVVPDYHGKFYIEPDGSKFERAVKKTRSWMKKCRSLGNPLHYSPPPIPTITLRLCDPLPVEEDLMSSDGESGLLYQQWTA